MTVKRRVNAKRDGPPSGHAHSCDNISGKKALSGKEYDFHLWLSLFLGTFYSLSKYCRPETDLAFYHHNFHAKKNGKGADLQFLGHLIVDYPAIGCQVEFGQREKATPSTHLVINDHRFLIHSISGGSLGLAESYMYNWIDFQQPDGQPLFYEKHAKMYAQLKNGGAVADVILGDDAQEKGQDQREQLRYGGVVRGGCTGWVGIYHFIRLVFLNQLDEHFREKKRVSVWIRLFVKRMMDWRNFASFRRLYNTVLLIVKELKLLFKLATTYLIFRFSKYHRQALDPHYGTRLQLYQAMLGPTMAYTCGIITPSNTSPTIHNYPVLARDCQLQQTAKYIKEHYPTQTHVEGEGGDPPSRFAPKEKPFQQLQDSLFRQIPDHIASTIDPSAIPYHPFDSGEECWVDLDGLQLSKFRVICEKLQLCGGQTLLDIGCGYGSFAIYAARNYGVTAVGFCNVSQMIEHGKEIAATELGPQWEQRVQLHVSEFDFLKTLPDESFDAVSSIGCFEHVYEDQYPFIFDQIKRILKPHGRALIHGLSDGRKPGTRDAFIQTYVFPNSRQYNPSNILDQVERRNMALLDVQNIGTQYAATLMGWSHNLKAFFAQWNEQVFAELQKDRAAAPEDDKKKSSGATLVDYDALNAVDNEEQEGKKKMFRLDFIRMWMMYLEGCMACASYGPANLTQILFAKSNRPRAHQKPWTPAIFQEQW